MKEKGKTIIIDSEEEAEESPTRIEEDISKEDPVQLVQQPRYMPPSKGMSKVPTNLDNFSSIITTPSPKRRPNRKFSGWPCRHDEIQQLQPCRSNKISPSSDGCLNGPIRWKAW